MHVPIGTQIHVCPGCSDNGNGVIGIGGIGGMIDGNGLNIGNGVNNGNLRDTTHTKREIKLNAIWKTLKKKYQIHFYYVHWYDWLFVCWSWNWSGNHICALILW